MEDRYNKYSELEKTALKRLYEYLGFNEIVSFNEYLEYIFLNAKDKIKFDNILNHSIKHIVTSFWNDYPKYKANNYIKIFWIDYKQINKFTEVGGKLELDPLGLLRHYVKTNFKKLMASKK